MTFRKLYPKSPLTQELVNTFPSWSKVRNNEQSIGYQLLNVFAQPMERMHNKLQRMMKNQFLSTVNLNEVDRLYAVTLPSNKEFTISYKDPVNPQPSAPTVSGLYNDGWHTITPNEINTLEDFWDNSIPTYFTMDNSNTRDHEIFTGEVSEFPASGIFTHHLLGGYLYIETIGGINYLTIENQRIFRGQVILTGTTRKGTSESETLVFPWDMKQKTQKEWKYIDTIEVYNMEPDIQVSVTSADVATGPYLSFYNNKYSVNRTKIDEFFDIELQSGLDTTTLNYISYITDDWKQLVQGFSNKDIFEKWELLDTDNQKNPDMVDMAIEPFSTRIWVVDNNLNLFCYDSHDYMASGVDLLVDRTPGSDVQFDIDTPSVILGEDMRLIPWHARPVKELNRHRIWFQTPSGNRYGWKNGSVVSYTSNLWVFGAALTRSIINTIVIEAEERGEYLFVIESEFVDGDIQIDKVLIPVKYKTPLGEWDVSSGIFGDVLGLDFSSDQELWITTTSGHYKLMPHYDTMLIDYDNKTIYFREPYESVGIELND